MPWSPRTSNTNTLSNNAIIVFVIVAHAINQGTCKEQLFHFIPTAIRIFVLLFCEHIGVFVIISKARRRIFTMVHLVVNDSQHLPGMINKENPHALVSITSAISCA